MADEPEAIRASNLCLFVLEKTSQVPETGIRSKGSIRLFHNHQKEHGTTPDPSGHDSKSEITIKLILALVRLAGTIAQLLRIISVMLLVVAVVVERRRILLIAKIAQILVLLLLLLLITGDVIRDRVLLLLVGTRQKAGTTTSVITTVRTSR